MTMAETQFAAHDHDEALESFVDKWRARWPEWAVAQVFVPAAQRPIALAWASLLQELTDAAWGGSDARPGEAKLAWWGEELQGWALGRRRHPLGAALQRQPAPWAQLASALPALRESRERPRDRADAVAALQPFARAVAATEAVLFEAPFEPAIPAVTAGLLHARLAQMGESAVPLGLLAVAGDHGPRRAWNGELLAHWPALAGARPRRIWSALARQRLSRGDAGLPLPPWATLLTAWRSAR
ncbi:phytoene/squalene synthase family protein [Lysobacter niastensis]|uniref:Phytoene/squalene synthase family protein n=1 Tax=Lysobacter niastensis TaxID=380629 RepID=A0ABS0B755_9GAMM|nr:phytoene/squalene synthase family protein [Lysobacter niastensis]MBF6023517.1 phytoene/squalene synthase family protein [Lysobacter niastensis]